MRSMGMNRYLRLLGVVVLVSLVFACIAVAQPRQRAALTTQPFWGEVRRLLPEVIMLMRLAALELTVDQLDAILEAGAESPAETESQALQDVRALRERLLRGEKGTVTDWQLISQAYWDMRRPDGNSTDNQQAIQLIRALLMPEQLSALAQGSIMGPRQQENEATRAPLAVLTALIGIMKEEDADKRQEGADALLKAIVEAAPEKPDEGMVEDLEDFFARVTEMDQVEFTEGQKELSTELSVLLPPDLDVGKLYMAMEPERVNAAITRLFMGEQARSLLKEMHDAKANVQ